MGRGGGWGGGGWRFPARARAGIPPGEAAWATPTDPPRRRGVEAVPRPEMRWRDPQVSAAHGSRGGQAGGARRRGEGHKQQWWPRQRQRQRRNFSNSTRRCATPTGGGGGAHGRPTQWRRRRQWLRQQPSTADAGRRGSATACWGGSGGGAMTSAPLLVVHQRSSPLAWLRPVDFIQRTSQKRAIQLASRHRRTPRCLWYNGVPPAFPCGFLAANAPRSDTTDHFRPREWPDHESSKERRSVRGCHFGCHAAARLALGSRRVLLGHWTTGRRRPAWRRQGTVAAAGAGSCPRHPGGPGWHSRAGAADDKPLSLSLTHPCSGGSVRVCGAPFFLQPPPTWRVGLGTRRLCAAVLVGPPGPPRSDRTVRVGARSVSPRALRAAAAVGPVLPAQDPCPRSKNGHGSYIQWPMVWFGPQSRAPGNFCCFHSALRGRRVHTSTRWRPLVDVPMPQTACHNRHHGRTGRSTGVPAGQQYSQTAPRQSPPRVQHPTAGEAPAAPVVREPELVAPTELAGRRGRHGLLALSQSDRQQCKTLMVEMAGGEETTLGSRR